MKKVVLEYFKFYIRATKFECEKLTFKEIIYIYIFIISTYFFFTFTFTYLIAFFNLTVSFSVDINSNVTENFFLIFIISPIIEEFLFRSVLKFNKTSYLFFNFSLLFICFNSSHSFKYILFFLLPIAGFFVFRNFSKIFNFFEKKMLYFIYFSSFIFASMHLLNFKMTQSLLFALPLIILPKIYLGISLSFVRLRSSLSASIVLHSLINGFLFLIASIFQKVF